MSDRRSQSRYFSVTRHFCPGRVFRYSPACYYAVYHRKKVIKKRRQRHLLDVLRGGCQQTLHLHFHQTTEPRVPVTMMLFRICEAALHRFFAPGINLFAPFRQPQRIRPLFRILPDMTVIIFFILLFLVHLSRFSHPAQMCLSEP